MLNLEKEQQQQLAAIQKEHNGELKAFYDEKDRIRKEYEAKIEMLQKELNESEKKRETEKSDGIVKPESK